MSFQPVFQNKLHLIEEANLALEKNLRQQTLMADISRGILSATDIEGLINENLRLISEFMEIHQAILLRRSVDGGTLVCTNEWIDPEDRTEIKSRLHAEFVLNEEIMAFVRAYGEDESDSSFWNSDNPSFRKAMSRYRLNSQNFITVPISIKGKLVAALDFSKDDDNYKWEESDLNLAKIFANTLSGVFEREEMERPYLIVENSPNFIHLVSTDGKVEYVNPAASKITGYTKAEMLEGGFDLIYDPETLEKVRNEYFPNALKYGVTNIELPLTCKDGSRRIMYATTMTTGNLGAAAIMNDITERKIAQSALVAAKEQAEQSSRAKGDFLSRMSHEMRTPMNAIINMVGLARETDDLDLIVRYLNKTDDASRHLLGIIDDVLNYTQLGDGSFTITITEFSLQEMLEEAARGASLYFEEKDQAFRMGIDPKLPAAILSDPGNLKYIVMKLLLNAGKFTPNEGKIGLKAFVLGEDDGWLTIQVEISDNGIGISKEKQDQVFRAFEQVDGGIDRRHGGIGLGLSLCKQIIRKLDGDIWVESESGKGTKISFTFRTQRAQVGEEKKEEELDFSALSFPNKTALLVEDNDINREIALSLLEVTDINIECAENGVDAVNMFAQASGKYDIIFMDVNMPEMDGIEATRRIRVMNPEGAKVPILALTANTLPTDVENYRKIGMNDVVGKPVDVEELLQKLQLYIYKGKE